MKRAKASYSFHVKHFSIRRLCDQVISRCVFLHGFPDVGFFISCFNFGQLNEI